MPILKRWVDSSPNFVSLFSFMKDYSSVLFLAKTIHSLLIRSPLKWKSLRLSRPQVKICQIHHANFETASRFFPKFSFILHLYYLYVVFWLLLCCWIFNIFFLVLLMLLFICVNGNMVEIFYRNNNLLEIFYIKLLLEFLVTIYYPPSIHIL